MHPTTIPAIAPPEIEELSDSELEAWVPGDIVLVGLGNLDAVVVMVRSDVESKENLH